MKHPTQNKHHKCRRFHFEDYCFIFFCISLVVITILGFYFINKDVTKDTITKKELCLANNYTYEEKRDGMRVNDCYTIDEGVIQFYNLFEMNGTKYLTRGIR